MATQPILSDLDMGGVAKIRNLPLPNNPDEPVRNDDTRLAGISYPIGATVCQPTPPADGNTWRKRDGSTDLRSLFPAYSALAPLNPPSQQFDPTIIGRGGFQTIDKNVGGPRADSTLYAVGDYRRPAGSLNPDFTFRCTSLGTSQVGEPAEFASPPAVGGFIADGGCIWQVEVIRYVACTNSTTTGNCIGISEDHCQTFRWATAPAAITEIKFTGKNFIGVANTTAYFLSSDNALTWSRSTHAQTLRSVASDGQGKILFGCNSTSLVYSTDNGVTSTTTGAIVAAVSGASSVIYQGVTGYTGGAGSEFMLITSAGVPYNINSSTWAAQARATATGMNQLSPGSEGRPIASASAGTTIPLYTNTNGATWSACATAPASCRNFRYSEAFGRWYGFSNTNAGTALYWATNPLLGWNTLTVAAYGIGITGLDTGDGKFVLACTNTTAATTSANLQKLASATTFEGAAGIPQAGASSFAFGEVAGKLFAINTGAATISQGLVNDGTGWRTLLSNSNFNLADRVFDLGADAALITRGSNTPYRSVNASAANPTFSPTGVWCTSLTKNADGSIVYYWDNGRIKRSTDRIATVGSNPAVGTTSPGDKGFVLRDRAGVYNAALGRHYFAGNSVNLKPAFYWINDAGTSDGIIETGLDNAQFDFIATRNDGSLILALSKVLGQVWGSVDNGTSWSYYSTISQSNSAWTDLLWMEPRKCFVAAQAGGMSSGLLPLWLASNGRQWQEGGSNSVNMSRVGYSATLDLLCMSSASASNTPLMQEYKEIDSTEFALPRPNDPDINNNYWTRVA